MFFVSLLPLSAVLFFFTLTCVFKDGRKLGAGHSNDDEDDQRPDDQSQRPQLLKRAGINSAAIFVEY